MQAIREQKLNTDHELDSETKLNQKFVSHMKLSDDPHQEEEDEEEEYIEAIDNREDDDDYDEEEEEEEFSFTFEGTNTSSIAAEDAFTEGQIKPVFPLFNGDLFFSAENLKSLHENLPMRLPVKKVFMETNEGDEGHHVTSAIPGSDEIAGPYCEWSMKKAVEAASSSCKKSNSTGFSRIWRLKDFIGRSNSDGKDAFVFLNNSQDSPSKAEVVMVEAIVKEKGEKRRSNNGGIDHGPPPKAETTVKDGGNVKKSGRSTKRVPLSAHEVYLKSKAKQDEKRRSYLPYRPELMGFFTNANVGLTKNVHPY